MKPAHHASAAIAASRHTGWRVGILGGVAVAVVAVHGCAAGWLAAELVALQQAADMPPRLAFVSVRDLEPTAPAPAARAAPAPASRAPPTTRPAAAGAASAASAPDAAPRPLENAEIASAAATASAPETPEAARAAEAAEAAAVGLAASAASAASAATTDEVAPPSVNVLAAAAPASTATAAFSWPESTRVTYRLTGNYHGEVHGSAQVEWIRQRDRYQMRMDILIGPPFAPLLRRQLSSEGTIGNGGLVPSRFDEDSKRAFQDRWRLTMLFAPDGIQVVGGRRFPPLSGVQDTVSQFVQLAYLFAQQPDLLTPGRQVEVPLALPRHVDRWAYLVLPPDTLSTPFGALEAAHLQPRRPAGNGDLSAEIWCAPTLRYLPVRIRIAQDAETYIDLLIDRKPQLAAPEQ